MKVYYNIFCIFMSEFVSEGLQIELGKMVCYITQSARVMVKVLLLFGSLFFGDYIELEFYINMEKGVYYAYY